MNRMTLAQFLLKFSRPVGRSNYLYGVVFLPYFLIDAFKHWNSQSIFVRPFILVLITIFTVKWFQSTIGRLVDLCCSRLWVLPITIPLIFYVWAIYSHRSSNDFNCVVGIM